MILILFSSQIHVWFEHKPSILFSINEITTIIPHSSKTSVLWTYLFTLDPISKNSPQKLSLSPPYFTLWPLSFHSSIVSVSFFPSDSFYYHSISAHFSCSFLLCYWQTSQMSKKNYFVIDCNDRIEFQCMHFCFSIFSIPSSGECYQCYCPRSDHQHYRQVRISLWRMSLTFQILVKIKSNEKKRYIVKPSSFLLKPEETRDVECIGYLFV